MTLEMIPWNESFKKTHRQSQTHNLNQSNDSTLLKIKDPKECFHSDSLEEPIFGSPKKLSVNSFLNNVL